MKKLLLYFVVASFLTSCATKKDILYFQDVQLDSKSSVYYTVPKIQVNDILSISVSALNVEATSVFNPQLSNNSAGQGGEQLKLRGYLVSAEGAITFPILGKIQVVGKTPIEAEELIKDTLISSGQLVNPVVSVRVVNGKITILGDISSPGTYSYLEQNITLLQALGMAGDLSLSAKRHDILIIREEDGVRTYGHIDMTKTDWFNSPYYYIKQNDIIYINPNGPKIKSAGYITNITGLISLGFTAFTLIVLLTK